MSTANWIDRRGAAVVIVAPAVCPTVAAGNCVRRERDDGTRITAGFLLHTTRLQTQGYQQNYVLRFINCSNIFRISAHILGNAASSCDPASETLPWHRQPYGARLSKIVPRVDR